MFWNFKPIRINFSLVHLGSTILLGPFSDGLLYLPTRKLNKEMIKKILAIFRLLKTLKNVFWFLTNSDDISN